MGLALEKDGREFRIGQRKQLNCDADPRLSWLTPWKVLEVEWPLRVVPSWAELARPKSSFRDQSLDVSHGEKGCHLGETAFSSRGNP